MPEAAVRWVCLFLAVLAPLLWRSASADPLGGTVLETTSGYPARTIALLDAHSPTGSILCSASLIGPNAVLTAGHCVTPGDRLATYANVSPGYDDFNSPYGVETASAIYASAGWRSSHDPNADWAIVALPDDALGRRVGWLQVDARDIGVGTNVAIEGYPGVYGGRQWRDVGYAYMLYQGSLYHTIPTVMGLSGAPVVGATTGNVLAVHAYVIAPTVFDHPTGAGPRITAAVLAEMRDACQGLGCALSYVDANGAISSLRPSRHVQIILPVARAAACVATC